METKSFVRNGIMGAVFLLGLASCSQTEKEPEVDPEEQRYLSELREKDSVIKEIFTSMEEIESEIDKVKQDQGVASISNTDAELTESQKDKIIRDVNMLHALLEENRKQIEEYKSTVSKYKKSESRYAKDIERLEGLLAEKETSLEGLKTLIAQMDIDINRLNYTVDSLKIQNFAQEDVIKTKDQKLQTAWYITGTRKELKEKGVISPKGGVLGMGKTSTVNNEIDNSQMNTVNIYQTTSIPVNAKKAKLISVHPSSSYSFKKVGDEVASIEILNADEFWKNTKYLVLETN